MDGLPAVSAGQAALLPTDLALEHAFSRAYEKPLFVPGKGKAAVPAEIAEASDIARVRNNGRVPGDNEQGLMPYINM